MFSQFVLPVSDDRLKVYTPYFRTVPKYSLTVATEEADYFYTPYILLGLRTKLQPWVNQHISEDISIIFTSDYINNEMRLKVILLADGTTDVELDSNQHQGLQRRVNQIVSGNVKSILLFEGREILSLSKSSRTMLLPGLWVRQMLSYISIDPSLNPYLSDQDGVESIYIEAGHLPDYDIQISDLISNIVITLSKMYQDGYIIYPSVDIITSWSLVPVDDQQILYHPTWSDDRLTYYYGGLVPFLIERMEGVSMIKLWVGQHRVKRHFVSKELSMFKVDFFFSEPWISVESNTLDQARKINSIITQSIGRANGKVLTLIGPSEETMTAIENVIRDEKIPSYDGDFSDYVIYQTDDPLKRYTFSLIVDLGTNIKTVGDDISLLTQDRLKYGIQNIKNKSL